MALEMEWAGWSGWGGEVRVEGGRVRPKNLSIHLSCTMCFLKLDMSWLGLLWTRAGGGCANISHHVVCTVREQSRLHESYGILPPNWRF